MSDAAPDPAAPMPIAAIRDYLRQEFPQVFANASLTVERAQAGRAAVRLVPDISHLRPGNIISGPTLMLLADATAYAALLSLTAEAKMAVTSTLNITFLRGGAADAPVWQHAEVLKRGRRLATIVAEARSGADGAGPMLAHTTMTYAMPLS